MSSILDLDALLTRIASLTKRLIDYRTFGILLLNEATQELEMKLAVRYGEERTTRSNVKLGEGLVGWAALHKEPVLVSDVSKDPRYINLVDDVRSELVIPMLIKERCIGVFDLESPELERVHEGAQGAADAAGQPGGRRHRERAALRRGATQRRAHREGAALRAARAGGAAADRAADTAATASTSPAALRRRASSEATFTTSSCPSRTRSLSPSAMCPAKVRPAALYGAFAAELVRSRTLRRRYTPDRFSVAGVLQSMNTILHERQLEEYYCTLCYAFFDFKRARRDAVEFGPAVSRSAARAASADRSNCPACRSGRSRA